MLRKSLYAGGLSICFWGRGISYQGGSDAFLFSRGGRTVIACVNANTSSNIGPWFEVCNSRERHSLRRAYICCEQAYALAVCPILDGVDQGRLSSTQGD